MSLAVKTVYRLKKLLTSVGTLSFIFVASTSSQSADISGRPYDVDTGVVMNEDPVGDCTGEGCVEIEQFFHTAAKTYVYPLGMLKLKFEGDGEGSCTALRVAKDAIMTSAHCMVLKKNSARAMSQSAKEAVFLPWSNGTKVKCDAEPQAMIWKVGGSKMSQQEDNWDIVFLKLKNPDKCELRSFAFFNISPLNDIEKKFILLHNRSGGGLKATLCASPIINPPSLNTTKKFATNCKTNFGSSGGVLYQRTDTGHVIVGIHQGSQVVQLSGTKHRVSLELKADQLKTESLSYDTLTAFRHLTSEYAKRCARSQSLPNCTVPSISQHLAAVDLLDGKVFADPGGVLPDNKAVDAEGDSPMWAQGSVGTIDAEHPGLMPDSNVHFRTEISPDGKSARLMAVGFAIKDYKLKPVSLTAMVPKAYTGGTDLLRVEWNSETLRIFRGKREIIAWAKAKSTVRALPDGVVEIQETARTKKLELQLPDREICSEEQSIRYQPDHVPSIFNLESSSESAQITRSMSKFPNCLPTKRDGNGLTSSNWESVDPIETPGMNETRVWEDHIASSLDLPAHLSIMKGNDVQEVLFQDLPSLQRPDGIIPGKCPSGTRCALAFKLVQSRSREISDDGLLPINRTYKLIAVERISDRGGKLIVRTTSCQAHPKESEDPIDWPKVRDVLNAQCPKQANGSVVDAVTTYTLYRKDKGIVCSLYFDGKPNDRSVTRSWRADEPNKECLKKYIP